MEAAKSMILAIRMFIRFPLLFFLCRRPFRESFPHQTAVCSSTLPAANPYAGRSTPDGGVLQHAACCKPVCGPFPMASGRPAATGTVTSYYSTWFRCIFPPSPRSRKLVFRFLFDRHPDVPFEKKFSKKIRQAAGMPPGHIQKEERSIQPVRGRGFRPNSLL